MIKTLFYTGMFLNFIFLGVFLFVIIVGISDELATDMVEKTRLFFAFKKLDIFLISIFGILLPLINLYILFKVNLKIKL